MCLCCDVLYFCCCCWCLVWLFWWCDNKNRKFLWILTSMSPIGPTNSPMSVEKRTFTGPEEEKSARQKKRENGPGKLSLLNQPYLFFPNTITQKCRIDPLFVRCLMCKFYNSGLSASEQPLACRPQSTVYTAPNPCQDSTKSHSKVAWPVVRWSLCSTYWNRSRVRVTPSTCIFLRHFPQVLRFMSLSLYIENIRSSSHESLSSYSCHFHVIKNFSEKFIRFGVDDIKNHTSYPSLVICREVQLKFQIFYSPSSRPAYYYNIINLNKIFSAISCHYTSSHNFHWPLPRVRKK